MTTQISEPAPTVRFNAKREAIISAASHLFNERGVVGATLTDVAASVGLVKNSITYYYRRKEDLAVACFNQAIAVSENLIEKASGGATVQDRVVALLRLHAGLHADIAEGRRSAIVMFHDMRALPKPQVDEVFSAYTAMFRRLRRLLKGKETQALERETLNARTHILLSLVNSMRVLAPKYEAKDHDRMVSRLSDIVLNGMAHADSHWVQRGDEEQWLLGIQSNTLTEQFLHSAIELINEQGFHGASVVKISERLNLTKGAFYYYNANKDDLVEQCFAHSFEIVRKAIDLAESVEGSGWTHLTSLTRGLVRFQLSESGPLLRSTAYSALPDPVQRAKIAEATDRMVQRISGVLVSGLMDGSIRPMDTTLASHYALNAINAAAELKRWAPTATEETVCDIYAKPVLLGLLKP